MTVGFATKMAGQRKVLAVNRAGHWTTSLIGSDPCSLEAPEKGMSSIAVDLADCLCFFFFLVSAPLCFGFLALPHVTNVKHIKS